jgi:alkylation response protein AidB-like acyl-CoA dehydrogenase
MTASQIVKDFDSYLTPAERALVERGKDFGRRVVAPNAAEWDRQRCVPLEALRAACAEGLASVELPPSFGGPGLRFSAKLRLVEELAKLDFAFAFSLVNHHNAMVRIARADADVAQRLVPRMLTGELIGCAAYTEPGHGSDLSGIVTTAQKSPAGWTLDGEKAWITNAAVAGVAITLAQTEPAARSRGMASFIVEADRAGFLREPAYDLQGCHAIGTGGFRLERYAAPHDALLDPPGEAFRRIITGINGARAYVAAMCAGMLESAIERAVRYTATRRAFGNKLIEFQGLRWSLVDAETDLAALRLMVYRAARRIDAGESAEEDAARAKKFAGERTMGHLAACLQALGASGLRADQPLARHLLAAKTAGFTDGTTEMMNERLGKLVVSRYLSGDSGPA